MQESGPKREGKVIPFDTMKELEMKRNIRKDLSALRKGLQLAVSDQGEIGSPEEKQSAVLRDVISHINDLEREILEKKLSREDLGKSPRSPCASRSA